MGQKNLVTQPSKKRVRTMAIKAPIDDETTQLNAHDNEEPRDAMLSMSEGEEEEENQIRQTQITEEEEENQLRQTQITEEEPRETEELTLASIKEMMEKMMKKLEEKFEERIEMIEDVLLGKRLPSSISETKTKDSKV